MSSIGTDTRVQDVVVKPSQVAAMRDSSDDDAPLVLDVREAAEYAREHIEGAYLTPKSKVNDWSQQLDRERTLVLYCETGVRCRDVARELQSYGFADVHQLEDGLAGWKRAGLTTVRTPRAPIAIMRQVQIIAGLSVLAGTLLGAFVSPYWLILSGFFGAGLAFAGATGTCGLATMLRFLPWNRVPHADGTSCVTQGSCTT